MSKKKKARESEEARMVARACSTCDGKGVTVAVDSKGRKIGYDTCANCGGEGWKYSTS